MTFQTALDYARAREERNATVLILLWTAGVFAVVLVPESYWLKALGIVASWFALLIWYYFYNPDATYNRAWHRATKEVVGK